MSVRVTKTDPDHMQAWCEECDWRGVVTSIRTAEGCELVARDAHEHAAAHDKHTGFFDYERGWVAS